MQSNIPTGSRKKSVLIMTAQYWKKLAMKMKIHWLMSPARTMIAALVLFSALAATAPAENVISPNPTNLNFTAIYCDTNTISTHDFVLTVPAGVSPTAYLLSTNQNWLSVANSEGDVSGTIPSPGSTNITVTVSTNGLTVGNYVGIILNDAAGVTGWTNVTVNFNVVLAPVPTNLNFTAVYGETPSPQPFNLIVPEDVSPTAYLLGTNQNWLSVANSEGDVSGTIPTSGTNIITVTIVPGAVSPTELSVGRHTGTVTVGSNWLDVAVVFDVVLRPDPTNLTVNARYGDPDPATNFVLTVPVDVSPTAYLLGTNQNWLSVADSEGDVSGTIDTGANMANTVTISMSGLSAGSTNGTITVGSNWLDVAVNLNIDRGIDAITFSDTNQTYNGSALSVTATSTYANAVTVTYNGSYVPPTTVGIYAVTGIVDTNNWTGTNTTTLTIAKATPTVTTWPTASEITYGQALVNSTLIGGVPSVTGIFAFATPGTIPDAGTYSAIVTFTPTDTANYNTIAGNVDVTVNKATPTVTTWPTASEITYGQAISNSVLSGGTGSVTGTFAFASPGTIPDAGTYAAAVTFTPTDMAKYNPVAGNIAVAVNKANQMITFAAIPYQVVTGVVTLSATADSGLMVSFSATGPAVITDGNTLTFTGPGTVSISASQSGNDNWKAAEDITVNLNVRERELQFLAADFDGDGLADPAVYEMSSGTWRIRLSSADYAVVPVIDLLGGPGWVALAADFDGDGLADPTVYRESDGVWLFKSSILEYHGIITMAHPLGGAGYSGIPADYDGDGLADPCVYKRATGDWHVRLSMADYRLYDFPGLLGEAGYKAVAADYDGDNKADPAVYRESDGLWVVMLSSGDYRVLALGRAFGGPGYLPVPADYDGDGLADPAVKDEASNEWIVMFSTGDYTPVNVPLLFE